MSLIGYRKFIVALCCWASSVLLCLNGQVTGEQYVILVGLVVGMFGVANIGAKIIAPKQ